MKILIITIFFLIFYFTESSTNIFSYINAVRAYELIIKKKYHNLLPLKMKNSPTQQPRFVRAMTIRNSRVSGSHWY